MGIVIEREYRPIVDEGDPDDYRPNSSIAMVLDPTRPDGQYVNGLMVLFERMAPGDRIPLHVHTIAEEGVTFNAQIDFAGLHAYRTAVAARTRTVVTALNSDYLEELVNGSHFQTTFVDGVIGNEHARWLEQFFAKHSQAWWLGFINWHGAEHLLGEAFYIRSQNGIPVGV